MKLFIVMDKDGMRRIAEGGEPYAWDFRVTSTVTGALAQGILMAELEVTLPSRESMIEPVLKNFDEALKEIREKAYLEQKEIEEAKKALLQLAPPSAAVFEVSEGVGI